MTNRLTPDEEAEIERDVAEQQTLTGFAGLRGIIPWGYVEQLLAEVRALRAERDGLAKTCASLEADREYNASLVIERDGQIEQAEAELSEVTRALAACHESKTL